jgi:hypothetical protein
MTERIDFFRPDTGGVELLHVRYFLVFAAAVRGWRVTLPLPHAQNTPVMWSMP